MMKYRILTLLLVCTTLFSCTDDLELVDANSEEAGVFADGYSLTMKVTLDNMGGTGSMRATGDEGENPLAELENYIDPEKFRVLFFDREDRFLFESKSRWIKKIVPNGENDHSEWFVSVPLYDYGNDEAYNWNWEEIRRVLTGEDEDDEVEITEGGQTRKVPLYKKDANGNPLPWAFKIAILANRPGTEWSQGINGRYTEIGQGGTPAPSAGLAGTDIPGVELTPNGWKLQNGPFWNSTHTRWGQNPKTVFDLHHCQYDPIYDGKSYNDRGGVIGNQSPNDGGLWRSFGPNKNYWYEDLDVYDFISGRVKPGEGYDEFEDRPTMGATSTWVSWKNNDTDGDPNLPTNNYPGGIRKFVRLDKSHPIPMYGIQSFNKIGEDWVKGTPFNLSHIAEGQNPSDYNFKSISLLRSVVKLELILPKTLSNGSPITPLVGMVYPNVYARCEPMDVWTPTDSIWNDDDNHLLTSNDENHCEWFDIKKYGPISRTNKYLTNSSNSYGAYNGSVQEYKHVMKWFYGAWLEKGWPFPGISSGAPVPKDQKGNNLKFPRIFNSCVQRNGQVSCANVDYSDLYGDGYYHFIVYTGEKNINDPSNITEMGKTGNGAAPITSWWVRIGNVEYGFALAPYEGGTIEETSNSKKSVYIYRGTANITSRFRDYEARVQGYTARDMNNPNNNTLTTLAEEYMPWPLVRNHVYRIKINSIMRSGGDGGISVQSEVLRSKTINFDKPKEEKKETKKK